MYFSGAPLPSSLHTKVQIRFILVFRAVLIKDVVFAGARHLYLIDLSEENLPDLESTIEHSYPDVKVTYEVDSQFHQLISRTGHDYSG